MPKLKAFKTELGAGSKPRFGQPPLGSNGSSRGVCCLRELKGSREGALIEIPLEPKGTHCRCEPKGNKGEAKASFGADAARLSSPHGSDLGWDWISLVLKRRDPFRWAVPVGFVANTSRKIQGGHPFEELPASTEPTQKAPGRLPPLRTGQRAVWMPQQ